MAVDRDLTVSSPGAYARDLAQRLGVAGFRDWWLGELAGLVPSGPRAAWQRRRLRPVLAFDGARATLWRPVVRERGIAMDPQATIALDGNPDDIVNAGRHALAAQARAAGDGGAVVATLALPPRSVLRKQLTLPLAVEENLRQVVAYDLDRHTPFKTEELYFDAHVASRDAARGVLRVDLAAARRSIVDPLLRHAESWGATVVAISPDDPHHAASSTLNLLPPELRNGRAPWRRWQFWLPIALLALLAAAATILPLWQKREYAIALMQDAEAARVQAAVSETLRTQLERAVDDYNFALARKFAFAPTVQVLDDVSRLMPDDTWLTQLELRTSRTKESQRELNLRGESANAGRLVSVLEDSKLFTQAAPRSPTTKIQPGPGEIFDVGAQLKPLPAPSSTPLVIASANAPRVATPATVQRPGASPAATQANPGAAAPAKSAVAPAASKTAPPASTSAQPAEPVAEDTAEAAEEHAPAASGAPHTPATPAPGAASPPGTSAAPPARTGTAPPPAPPPVPPPGADPFLPSPATANAPRTPPRAAPPARETTRRLYKPGGQP